MRVIDAGCGAVFLAMANGNKGQEFMDFQDRWGRLRRAMRNKLWLRPALASLFSVLAAFAALWAELVVPEEAGFKIDEDSLVGLLSIFASSMLSVATFTVSAIVAAASSASNSTTPRATRQVISDGKAQLVLSAFIAAFIYSFIAIIALKIFQYGAAGRLMLFAGLVVMVVFVLISFINWIDHAMKLGRQSTTIAKLKEVAENSITPATAGTFGARPFTGERPGDGALIRSEASGYVSALGLSVLQKLAEEGDCHVVLLVRPGEYCAYDTAIATVVPAGAATDSMASAIREAVELDDVRHEDVDVRFNVVNLAETADRALSPGINDPGTAIYIMNALGDVLVKWSRARRSAEAQEVRFDRISVPPLLAREVVADAFTPIARDGAGAVEVGVRLQKVLATLARCGDADLKAEAERMSAIAFELSDAAIVSGSHKTMLQAAWANSQVV
jgi:uncharacterized membrane protein